MTDHVARFLKRLNGRKAAGPDLPVLSIIFSPAFSIVLQLEQRIQPNAEACENV